MKKIICLMFAIVLCFGAAACGRKAGSEKLRETAEPDNTAGITDDGKLFDRIVSASAGLAAAKAEGYVVVEDGECTAGREALASFFEKTEKKEPAKLMLATLYSLKQEQVGTEYYDREKDNYPKLFLTEVVYDGDVFNVCVRLSDEKEPDREDTFKVLKHFEGDTVPSASLKKYEVYALVDDNDLTWESITAGMVSDTAEAYANTRHCTIYMTFRNE